MQQICYTGVANLPSHSEIILWSSTSCILWCFWGNICCHPLYQIQNPVRWNIHTFARHEGYAGRGLPRLELCGAALLAKMELNRTNSEAFYWPDSTIVLSWLQKPPCYWPTFVANRVSYVLDIIVNGNWRHVESFSNPTELPSQGMTANELVNSGIWWKGSTWLSRPRSGLPKCCTQLETLLVQVNFNTTTFTGEILSRFSYLSRSLRVLSYVFRLYHSPNKTHWLSQKYLSLVKRGLIILCQSFHFPECSILNEGTALPRKSFLLSFNCIFYSNSFLKVNGRLSRSPTFT